MMNIIYVDDCRWELPSTMISTRIWYHPKSQKAPSRRQVIPCWHPRGRLARPSATPFDCPSAMKSTELRHEEPWVKCSYLTWLHHGNTFQMLSFWWFLIFKIVFFRLFRRTCGCRQQNWTTTVGFETGFVIGLWAKVGLQQYLCGRWDVHPQIGTPWLCVGRWFFSSSNRMMRSIGTIMNMIFICIYIYIVSNKAKKIIIYDPVKIILRVLQGRDFEGRKFRAWYLYIPHLGTLGHKPDKQEVTYPVKSDVQSNLCCRPLPKSRR